MSLIALADFKTFIHMAEAFDDVLLQDIIDGEEAIVSQYMNQDLNQVLVETEYHDGNRDNTVLLNHGLVTAVTTVKTDDNNDGVYENTLTYWTDYVWYANGVIQLQSGWFRAQMKLIEVIYIHGYTSVTVPNDLKLALMKQMANTYQGSMHAIETEGPEKEFNEKYIYNVFDKYARLAI